MIIVQILTREIVPDNGIYLVIIYVTFAFISWDCLDNALLPFLLTQPI